MQIIIAASDAQQQEMADLGRGNGGTQIIWVQQPHDFLLYPDAGAYVDVLFDGAFFSPANAPLLIASTNNTLLQFNTTNTMLVRFCDWPGFLQRPLWELAVAKREVEWLAPLMAALGKQYTLVNDVPGLVAPRVIAAIINEACYALDEQVADAQSIDLAMTLGTNYPYGPMDWLQKIGTSRVQSLLAQMAIEDPLYAPHPLLQKHS